MLSGDNVGGNANHEGGNDKKIIIPVDFRFNHHSVSWGRASPRAGVTNLGIGHRQRCKHGKRIARSRRPVRLSLRAFGVTTAGGEIDVLSPGGYGALTITHPLISIIDDGSGEAGILVSGTNGITIAAGPTDVVNLRGLIFNGTNASQSAVQILSAGLITIQNSVLQQFGIGAPGLGGVNITPSSGTVSVIIQNTSVIGNNLGVYAKPAGGATVNLIIDHSVINGNYGAGVRADGTGGGTVIGTISNSSISLNATNGIISITGPGSSTVNVMNDVIFGNSQYGVVSNQNSGGTSTVVVGASMISNNFQGATNSVSGGSLRSFMTNQVTGPSGTGFSSSDSAAINGNLLLGTRSFIR